MNLKAVLEGLLFVCGDEGLSKKQISTILEINEEESFNLINQLVSDYEDDSRGIRIEFFGDYLKLVTKKEYKEYLKKLVPDEEDFLTQSNLETLAIIAYNQPITRSQIEEVRGVSSTHIIRKLLIRNLIQEVGRSELPGRPILYGTSDFFLDYFGISSLEQLPVIETEEIVEETSEVKIDETEEKKENKESTKCLCMPKA